MKSKVFSSLIVVILSAIINFSSYAQEESGKESKGNFSINFTLSHYHRITENELNLGDASFNLTPGIELLYNYPLRRNTVISSGIMYQYADLESHVETTDRFKTGELNIPLLFTFRNNSKLSFQVGTYFGMFLHFDWDYYINSSWEDRRYRDNKYYRDKNLYIDSFFAFNLKVLQARLHISPFVKYRIKENWMDHYRSSTMVGIKVGTPIVKRNN